MKLIIWVGESVCVCVCIFECPILFWMMTKLKGRISFKNTTCLCQFQNFPIFDVLFLFYKLSNFKIILMYRRLCLSILQKRRKTNSFVSANVRMSSSDSESARTNSFDLVNERLTKWKMVGGNNNLFN
jgi:hypothetical protein